MASALEAAHASGFPVGGISWFEAAAFAEFSGSLPTEHKKRVMLEGGHVPNDFNRFVREALDWYDKYLGPVK